MVLGSKGISHICFVWRGTVATERGPVDHLAVHDLIQHGTNRCLEFCEASPRPEVANGEVCRMLSLTMTVTWHDTCHVEEIYINAYRTTDASLQYHHDLLNRNQPQIGVFHSWFKMTCREKSPSASKPGWKDPWWITGVCTFLLQKRFPIHEKVWKVVKLFKFQSTILSASTFGRNHQVLRWALQVRVREEHFFHEGFIYKQNHYIKLPLAAL